MLAVELVLDVVDDGRDLAELDRHAVAVGHDDVAVLGGVAHRRRRVERGVRVVPTMVPTGVFELVLARTLCTSSRAMPRDAAGDRIDLDPDGEFLRAEHQNLGDARRAAKSAGPA